MLANVGDLGELGSVFLFWLEWPDILAAPRYRADCCASIHVQLRREISREV